MSLPDYTPVTSNEPAFDGFVMREWGPSAQFPPIEKHPDGRLVVDWWEAEPEWKRTGSRRAVLKLWARADHPNLANLPWNAPRAVKSLYRREGQIKVLRGDYKPVIAALDAWAMFVVQSNERTAAA